MIPEIIKKESPVIFDGPKLLIREIVSFRAAKHFSIKRGWCTKTENTYIHTYGPDRGRLFNFFIKPKERAEAQLFVSHKGYKEFKLKYNKNGQISDFLQQDPVVFNWADSELKLNIGSMHKIKDRNRVYRRNYHLIPFINQDRRYLEPQRMIDTYGFQERDILSFEESRTGYKWSAQIIYDQSIHIHRKEDQSEIRYHLENPFNRRYGLVFYTENERFVGLIEDYSVYWFELLDISVDKNLDTQTYKVKLDFFIEIDNVDTQLLDRFDKLKNYEIVGGDFKDTSLPMLYRRRGCYDQGL